MSKQPFPFGTRWIGSSEPVIIIAEVGINHEGDVETCAAMVEAAAKAGADAIKLQTVDADENYAPGTESHRIFSNAALTREETARIFDLIRLSGAEPFTTAGDFETLNWVDLLNPSAFKISSGLLTSTPIISRAARTGRPVLMSTGMASHSEIDDAVTAARNAGGEHLALFQCTSVYPAPLESLNLGAIAWLEEQHGVPVGFSDHSQGIDAAPLAVAAGACIIEKHFSFDPSRDGFDHRLSLGPEDFALMVQNVRKVETALGSREKVIGSQESANAGRYHRVLAARRNIGAGAKLTEGDIGIMRLEPGSDGMLPKYYHATVGRTVNDDLKRHDPIREKDLK